jgi:hypothetical protein
MANLDNGNKEAAKMQSTLDIIQDLVYMSYRYNRLRSPDISVERWSKLFDVEVLEPKFQAEINRSVRV